MSAENQRKAYRYNCNMIRPQIYSEKSLMESVVDFFSDVVPQAYSTQKMDDKEKIQWVRFENCDCSDIARNPDLFKYDTKGLPLLLILGYSNGVQIWQITPNGEALEILSIRQGPVKICRILPYPEPVLGHTDSFTSKRPLIVMCDSSSAGQPFCGMKFVSLKTGDEVHSVSFKTLPIHNIECNKRFLVVTFLEKICIYESCRFKQLFWITSCFPCPAPNVNPIALSTRWLAYADKRLVAMHQSCGGMSGDGTQSYAATVISAAKGAFKGLSMFGEAMVNSMTGCKPSSSKKQPDYVHLDNGNRPGIVTVVDIQNVHNDHFNVNEDNEGTGLIAHFHAHANEPVADMAFDPTGTLLVTACKLGHNFHIFRVMAHPCSSSLGAVHHLYTLHRGDTTAKVIDIGFNHDSRWVTVSTHRGTTHIFAITPYGGIPNVRTHCQPFVVNRASRFHRSAGLEDIEHSPLGRRSPVLSTSPSSSGHYDRYPTLIQQNTLNNNMGNPRLPPYPHPITVYPLFQIKQPLNVVLNPGNKNLSPNHSPTGLDNIFSVASKFCTPRLCVVGSPKLDVERRDAGKRPVDCLFIMAQSGTLVEYVLEPKARTVSEKVSEESLLELNVVGRMQWNLQRLKTSSELRPPLPSNSPLILSHEAIVSEVPTAPEYYDLPGLTRHDSKDSLSSDHSGKDEDEWVSQVEIITHAGPHRRLWMGPQFSFKTYHENTTVLSSQSSALLSQSSETNMVAMDITGEEGDLESLRVQPTRSNPVSMPNARPAYRRLSSDSSPSPGLSGHSAPLLIEAGSFDQSPHLLDVYSNWTESTVEKQPRGSDDVEDDRIKETLADAMVESPMRDMEKLSLRQEMSRTIERKMMAESDRKKSLAREETRPYKESRGPAAKQKQPDEKPKTERGTTERQDSSVVTNPSKGRKAGLDKKKSATRLASVPESNGKKTEERGPFDQGAKTSSNIEIGKENTGGKEDSKQSVDRIPSSKGSTNPPQTEVTADKNVAKAKKKKNKSSASSNELSASLLLDRGQSEQVIKNNEDLNKRDSTVNLKSAADEDKNDCSVSLDACAGRNKKSPIKESEVVDKVTDEESGGKEYNRNNVGEPSERKDSSDRRNDEIIPECQNKEEISKECRERDKSAQDKVQTKNAKRNKKGKEKKKTSINKEEESLPQPSRERSREVLERSIIVDDIDSLRSTSKENTINADTISVHDLKVGGEEICMEVTSEAIPCHKDEEEKIPINRNEHSIAKEIEVVERADVNATASGDIDSMTDGNGWFKPDKKKKKNRKKADNELFDNLKQLPENTDNNDSNETKHTHSQTEYVGKFAEPPSNEEIKIDEENNSKYSEVETLEKISNTCLTIRSEKEDTVNVTWERCGVVNSRKQDLGNDGTTDMGTETLTENDKSCAVSGPDDIAIDQSTPDTCSTSFHSEGSHVKKTKRSKSKAKEEMKQENNKPKKVKSSEERELQENYVSTNLHVEIVNKIESLNVSNEVYQSPKSCKISRENDTKGDKQANSLEFTLERMTSLERSPSFESVRSTLSEDGQLVRNDDADSEVLASTEQSDSDMIEVKSKKKKKKKKTSMEESLYFEADEPGFPSPSNTPNDDHINIESSVSCKTLIEDVNLIPDNDSKLCPQNIPAIETENDRTDDGHVIVPTDTNTEEGEMFVVKSKKSKKNGKSKRADQDIRETSKSPSVERDIAITDKASTEITSEVRPVLEDAQSINTDPAVYNIEDPTAWELEAKLTPVELQTTNAIKEDIKTGELDNVVDKKIVLDNESELKDNVILTEPPDASNSSSRSSEERDLKENKSNEPRADNRNKKKRRKNKK